MMMTIIKTGRIIKKLYCNNTRGCVCTSYLVYLLRTSIYIYIKHVFTFFI